MGRLGRRGLQLRCCGGLKFFNQFAVTNLEQVRAADEEPGDTFTDLRLIVRAHSEGWARVLTCKGNAAASDEAVFQVGEQLPPPISHGEVAEASGGFRSGTTAVDG